MQCFLLKCGGVKVNSSRKQKILVCKYHKIIYAPKTSTSRKQHVRTKRVEYVSVFLNLYEWQYYNLPDCSFNLIQQSAVSSCQLIDFRGEKLWKPERRNELYICWIHVLPAIMRSDLVNSFQERESLGTTGTSLAEPHICAQTYKCVLAHSACKFSGSFGCLRSVLALWPRTLFMWLCVCVCVCACS